LKIKESLQMFVEISHLIFRINLPNHVFLKK
jgi:hypothetical protein